MATSNPIVTLSRNRMFLSVICVVLAAGLVVLIFVSVVAGMTIKEFRNGQWVECDTSNPDGCDVDTSTKEIHLEKSRGVYELPVRVNGVLTLDFVLDTGAAEVNIPANIAAQLLRSGSISQEDFLPGRIYQLADGTLVRSSRVILRELDLGGVKVSRVPASIGPAAGTLLLGQSFLQRLGAWSLDNKRNVLLIGR